MLGTILGIAQAAGAFMLTPAGIGAGLATVVIAYVLKRIDNKWVYKPVYGVFYSLGVIITGGLSKIPVLKTAYNKTLEPFLVDLLENIFTAMKDGLFGGLHSDNK